jgi:hypothetical protein
MGSLRSTKLAAKQRIQRQRRRRAWGLTISGAILASLLGVVFVKHVLAPFDGNTEVSIATVETPPTPTATLVVEVQATEEPTAEPTKTPSVITTLPTQAQVVVYPKDTPILYYAQSGDSLDVLAVHFGVEVGEIRSTIALPEEGFISPGQLLLIPSRLDQISSPLKLIPDTEVVNSPSTVDFDIRAFVNEAGGYLSTYKEDLASTGKTSGADIIARVSREYSVNPRLILALLEYQSGWVYGQPDTQIEKDYAMGYVSDERKGLFNQCAWVAGKISDGYYGWREGRVVALSFPDKAILRMAPDLNSGTVGIMNLFSQLNELPEWGLILYGTESFFEFYATMFGNPWVRALAFEPLFTPAIVQPEMILPIEAEKRWAYTGGPHAAWGVADVRAALDFAPPSDAGGCIESPEWVLAAAPGLIVRSEFGAVVIDMDGDGFEQTGWNIVYMHIATKHRVPVGTVVDIGDRLGHPSCEGGRSTGTHFHIARKFNGEWVPADGPLAFNLGGWIAKAGSENYTGWLIKDDKIIRANLAATFDSQIWVGK